MLNRLLGLLRRGCLPAADGAQQVSHASVELRDCCERHPVVLESDRAWAAIGGRMSPGYPALRRSLIASQVDIMPLDTAVGTLIKKEASAAEIGNRLECAQARLFLRLANCSGCGILARLEAASGGLDACLELTHISEHQQIVFLSMVGHDFKSGRCAHLVPAVRLVSAARALQWENEFCHVT